MPTGAEQTDESRITVALDGRGVEKGSEVLIEGAKRVLEEGIALRVFGDTQELKPLADAGASVKAFTRVSVAGA